VRLRPDEPLRPEWVRLLEARYPGSTVVPVGRAALGLMALLQSWRSTRPACKVAVSGAVCHEVILAVLEAGCEPLFCDVDVANGLVPESEWARARKLGAEVAVVVHLYGNPVVRS
jgi:dTDP-4-amino-4,6-dideoxygalactose transaminase